MMEEKALQGGRVELLEKEAKQNEALQKQSGLKNVEKIKENRISTPCSENRLHQSAEVNSPRTQNNQTSWRKPCPVQGERPAQAAQGARGGEQAGRQATQPRIEPTKPQSIPHQCKGRTIPTEAPEPIKAVEEEVDKAISQLRLMQEKVRQRGRVELLEKKAKQNEALQKQSCLKNVEKIKENRISTQTSWRKQCPATRPSIEPTKPQSIPHQCKGRTIPTEAPEPIKDVEEEVDEGTSQLLAKENAILRGQVELLETDAKLNEALEKESRLKKVEAISDLELQLALKKVTEAETDHKLKQLEEALQLQKESQWELETNLTQTLLLLKSQEDAEMNLAQQRETGRQLQAALTELLTQSNSQQLQWQEEKGHLLQAMCQITSSLEEMRVVPKPKKLSLRKRIVQFFRRSGKQ
ncbi:hypothetical protein EYF80_064003 [Liparis tanakae]|uniref:Uncharacterized protein n=1 Tax=Liparis tanakae TaxID=230148 RepID=A0A4Z2EAU3_9TELE|nr:hypothetical protein EYF80_064003 [Liparis tanakae]